MKRNSPYPGLHRAPKRLADGTTKVYFYAWKSGPRISHDYGTPEFARAFLEATASRVPKKRTETLLSIFNQYQQSRGHGGGGKGFLELAESTQKSYIKYIRILETEFGDMPIDALKDRRCRSVFLKWRDHLAVETPRTADYAWTVLARMMSWAHDRRIISDNPCKGGGRVYQGSRAEIIWTDDDIRRFYEVAPAHLCLAMTIALWTGQRQGDLLALPWSAYDGTSIRLTQSKTKARVLVPVAAPLREALDASEKRGPLILTNLKGRPWTSDGFRTSWAKACAKADINGLTFHDLRGTTITKLAGVGCTHSEISAITGHKHADITSILEKHYLASDPELGKSAIRKLEEGTKSPNQAPNWPKRSP
jgi:integrase